VKYILQELASGETYQPLQTFYRPDPRQTPPATDADGMRMRNGKALGSPLASEGFEFERSPSYKPPRVKKARPVKAGKSKGPTLSEPLSVLTAGYKVPVKNMEEWVTRSVEKRSEEVAKRNGYVARPMNSFMLYRSAYADRVKQFCKENNHQVVSQVSGASWPMEPKEIREMYEKYASIERDNHHNANPDYKFAPNKNQNAAKKRKSYDDDDEGSDLDDEGSEWGAPSRSARQKRHRTRDREDSELSYQPSQYDAGRSIQHPMAYRNASSWYNANPGRAPPPVYQGSQYYQQTVHPYPYAQNVQDVRYQRVEGTMAHPSTGQAILGFPSNENPDFLQPYSNTGTQVPQEYVFDARQVDPRLAYPTGDDMDPYQGTSYEDPTQFQFTHGTGLEFQQQYSPVHHPGEVMLTDGRTWDDAGSDFDRLL